MTANAFFAKQKKRRFTFIEIEGLEKPRIRSLTATEKATLIGGWWTNAKTGDVIKAKHDKSLARWIQICIVDPEGELVFSEDQIDELMMIDCQELERIADSCILWNSWTKETRFEVDETEKNLESPSDTESTHD